MNNLPEVKAGVIAVSRDCFPVELSRNRRKRLIAECRKAGTPVKEIETIVENEKDVLKALDVIRELGVNALVIYLGNFGPEGPATLLARKFDGPVMFAAAAEESGRDLVDGRGDAYCGLLSASYNLGLRDLRVHIPEKPVGLPGEIAAEIAGFLPVARVVLGLRQLKIFTFGPRPYDFLACNAPIKPLYDLGIEIMENSELDLYDIFRKAEGAPEIKAVEADMARELGAGNTYPDLLAGLARYEVALMKFMESNLGASKFGIFANKCWPAFESYFGFVPCYVNARLAARGIPVACEVDIYGTLSEYVCACATELPVTILDINNTVPDDLLGQDLLEKTGYGPTDLFMGFHCGNTPPACMISPRMKYQLIMHRLLEPGREPDITRGTIEGRLRPGKVTIFRLQSTAGASLRSYVAEGEILDVDPKSFGGIGVVGIKDMARFYRHVLIEKKFAHHTAMAFAPAGKTLWAAMRLVGIDDLSFNRPAGMLYPGENPFPG